MSEHKQPLIGILIISTLKYKQFVEPLVESIKKYFLPKCKINVHLFTDSVIPIEDDYRVEITQHYIQSYKFPFATLYRYKIFCEHEDRFNEDYLFYIDCDMFINDYVGSEILNSVTVVSHPGFHISKGYGSPNVDERSTAYVEPEKRKVYVAGGFNGGSKKMFMKICHTLDKNISIDESKGIIAEHNDESHLNHLINTMNGVNEYTILDSSYCQPQQEYLRKAWGIDNLPIKIIALEKDHNSIRN